MRFQFSSLFLLVFWLPIFGQNPFPKDSILGSNQTPTYDELVDFYVQLSQNNDAISLFNMGDSDAGLPIYLCVLNAEMDSLATFVKARENTTVLINNGIHPGEPCGVNAAMQLSLDFTALTPKQKKAHPVIAIILSYNVGGTLNRSATSRVNQIGPEAYGFRGNARNFDLNRDFIKMDSENTWTFVRLFHALDPDVFVDTHTTNGADYSYVLTYIHPLKEKLAPAMRSLQVEQMLPEIKGNLKRKYDFTLFPYIVLKDKTLDKGIVQFDASPRYSIGYTELFNTISFITEAHMLKPFADRVNATYHFLNEVVSWTQVNSQLIEDARVAAYVFDRESNEYPAEMRLTTRAEEVFFEGYEWSFETSKITGFPRLKYHQDRPWNHKISHFNDFETSKFLNLPRGYFIKQSEKEIIKRLSANNIAMQVLSKDTVVAIQQQFINSFESLNQPYEGHFMHHSVKVDLISKQVTLKKGDVFIPSNQKYARFIHAVLFAEMQDSYFVWNFMDSYLNQKEYFSPYLFEETAEKILETNEVLKTAFESKKASDEEFANDAYAQLYYIYQNSSFFEPTFRLLPIYLVY